MRKILLAALALGFLTAPAIADGDYFALNPVTDPILLGSALALNGTYLLLDKVLDVKADVQFDGNLLSPSDVNALDRFFMQPYSKKLDTVADVTLVTALLAPGFLAACTAPSEYLTLGTMYAETLLLANGIKELIKLAVNRARPYMYYSGYPQDEVSGGDWCKSFLSGHSTLTFAAAGFASLVFCTYYPASKWKYAVIGGSYALAFATASLRLASGNHFFTDVAAGAVLGTLCGIGIPLLHRVGTVTRTRNTEVSLSPAGVFVGIRL